MEKADGLSGILGKVRKNEKMGIQMIDYNGASPYAKTVTTNKVQQAGGDFQNTVMKCTGTTTQKTALYSDALMSYASPQTGESVNIYKASELLRG